MPLTRSDLPPLLLRRDHHGPEVAGLVRAGTWTRCRKGAFLETASLPSDPYERDRTLAVARLLAVARCTTTPHAFSHLSAALLWGLPVVGADRRVHLTQATRPSGTHADDVVRHVGLPDEVVRVAGLPVTSLARTAADCARTLPGPQALVVLDAALRAGAARDAVGEILGDRRRGAARARAVLPWADDGAESAGESLARAALLAIGLPAPTTQLEVLTADGRIWADLGWEAWRLLVEYDGRSKYERGHASLLREKRREDLVRDCGWRILRLTAADLRDPLLLRRRVVAQLPRHALADLRPRGVLAR